MLGERLGEFMFPHGTIEGGRDENTVFPGCLVRVCDLLAWHLYAIRAGPAEPS